jgi:hypothetical protein
LHRCRAGQPPGDQHQIEQLIVKPILGRDDQAGIDKAGAEIPAIDELNERQQAIDAVGAPIMPFFSNCRRIQASSSRSPRRCSSSDRILRRHPGARRDGIGDLAFSGDADVAAGIAPLSRGREGQGRRPGAEQLPAGQGR